MIYELPEPEYYTVLALAQKFNCDTKTIMLYGQTGQLQMSLYCLGWTVQHTEVDAYEGDWFTIPRDRSRKSHAELLKIYPKTVHAILRNGFAVNPIIKVTDIPENEYYEILHDSSERDVTVTVKDIVIEKGALERFLKQGNSEDEPIRDTIIDREANPRWSQIGNLLQSKIDYANSLKPKDNEYEQFTHKKNVSNYRKGEINKGEIYSSVFEELPSELKRGIKNVNGFESSARTFCKNLSWTKVP